MSRTPFHFGSIPEPPGALVAHVPPGLVARDDLFDILELSLDFPDWWGRNWDALDELLRVGWEIEPGKVPAMLIVHADVPRFEVDQRRIYLDLLAGAVNIRAANSWPRLAVVFPKSDRSTVEQMLAAG